MKFKAAFLLLAYKMCFFQQFVLAQTQCNNGDVRLEGGQSEAEGRVEVCVKKKWGSVDGNNWGENDAKVLCRQLGYSEDNATVFTRKHFRQTNNNMKCTGSEEKLVNCKTYEPVDLSGCKDVGVRCQPHIHVPQNVTAVVSSTSVTISWRPPDSPRNKNVSLLYYRVICSAFVNVSNATYAYQVETQTQTSIFSVTLSKLLPSTAYTCCVSLGAYIPNSTACSSIMTDDLAGNSAITPHCNAVGGGLGALVVIVISLLIGMIVYIKFWQKTKGTDHRRRSTSTGNLYSILHNPTYDAHHMELPSENPNSSQYSTLGPDYEIVEPKNITTAGTEGEEYSHLRH